jgi:hypothetical protein
MKIAVKTKRMRWEGLRTVKGVHINWSLFAVAVLYFSCNG